MKQQKKVYNKLLFKEIYVSPYNIWKLWQLAPTWHLWKILKMYI